MLRQPITTQILARWYIHVMREVLLPILEANQHPQEESTIVAVAQGISEVLAAAVGPFIMKYRLILRRLAFRV